MSGNLISKIDKKLLSLIYFGMPIEAVDGSEIFVKSKDFFYVTPSFINTYAGGHSEPRERAIAIGLRLNSEATFEQMFSSLREHIEDLAFTESQVINFLKKNHSWMNTRGTTYFPFRYRDQVCVAAVFQNANRTAFGVDVYTFNDKTVWPAVFDSCIVIQWKKFV